MADVESVEQAQAIEAAFDQCRQALAQCAKTIEVVRSAFYGDAPAVYVDGENDWWYRAANGKYTSQPGRPDGIHTLATLRVNYPRRSNLD